MLGLWVKGLPILLALLVGILLRRRPCRTSWSASFIKRRINQFHQSSFPDAIELLVRGLRSGLPITETIGVVGSGDRRAPSAIEFRGVTDQA